MFSPLSYKPYEHVAVKDHILELEVLFVVILVDECSLKFTLLSHVELLDLDLLSEIHSVL